MTDHDRAEHLIEGLQRLESLAIQLSTAMRAALDDIEALNKAAYREGGIRGADRLGGALSGDALFALVRGRFHALGLEPLLQRTTHTTDPGWIDATAPHAARGDVTARTATERGTPCLMIESRHCSTALTLICWQSLRRIWRTV
jgi:hypothetical protein